MGAKDTLSCQLWWQRVLRHRLGVLVLMAVASFTIFSFLGPAPKRRGESGIVSAVVQLLDPSAHIFVEMGANDGYNSNTYELERRGWRGVCIEAAPSNFQLLQRHRPRCDNVQAVVSDRVGTAIFREFEGGKLYGHSGLLDSRSPADWQALLQAHGNSKYIDHTVQTSTLGQLLDASSIAGQSIDYFSLDVEGAETAILRHYPFDAYPVRVWTIESNKLDRRELVEFMHGHGYRCWHFDAINTICQQEQPAEGSTRSL